MKLERNEKFILLKKNIDFDLESSKMRRVKK